MSWASLALKGAQALLPTLLERHNVRPAVTQKIMSLLPTAVDVAAQFRGTPEDGIREIIRQNQLTKQDIREMLALSRSKTFSTIINTVAPGTLPAIQHVADSLAADTATRRQRYSPPLKGGI